MKMCRILTTVIAVLLAAPLAFSAPGSQLIFIADTGINFRTMDLSEDQMGMSAADLGYMAPAYKNFISVTNTHGEMAVTVMFQYYNDDMNLVLSYLRVVLAGQTILIDPFNVDLPGTNGFNSTERFFDDEDGDRELIAIGTDKKKGFNSGRFLISATAVATRDDGAYPAEVGDAADRGATILFPYEVVTEEELHKKNNIDSVGTGFAQAKDHDFGTTIDATEVTEENEKDDTTRNTGSKMGVNNDNLHPGNARAVYFNWLIGHQTTAVAGVTGVDSTASWALSALSRPVVSVGTERTIFTPTEADTTPTGSELYLYECLVDSTGDNATYLAEFTQGLAGAVASDPGEIVKTKVPATSPNGPWSNRGIASAEGALKLSALHSVPNMKHQSFNLISIADSYGASGGDASASPPTRSDAAYMALEAQTGYTVLVRDRDGDPLKDDGGSGSNIGGLDPDATADIPMTMHIVVSGIATYIGSNDKCAMGEGGRRDGYSLYNLAELYPDVMNGDGDKFDGLMVETDADAAAYNGSQGWLKFKRRAMTCEMVFNYPDASTGEDAADTLDIKRSFIGSTVRIEKGDAERRFATAAQFVLRYETPETAFAAAWWVEPSM